MANVVKILWSKITGRVPQSLLDGQIAINQKDKKLFYPNENGFVQEFDLNSASGPIAFKEVVANFGAVPNLKNNTILSVIDNSIMSNSKVMCYISGLPTLDHSTDEIMLLQLSSYATNIVQGVGFDIQVFSQHDTYGEIKINYLITN